MRPTRAEIDLSALRHNLNAIRSRTGATEIIAVVKADAYGHGAVPVAAELYRNGVRSFAVACLEEAVELQDAGVVSGARVIVLGPLRSDEIEEMRRRGLVGMVSCPADVDLLSRLPDGPDLSVVLDLDTGMGRMGLCPEELPDALDRLAAASMVKVVGVFSHFAVADMQSDDDLDYTRRQIQDFELLAGRVKDRFPDAGLMSLANSGGIFFHESSVFNAVRPGITLYGVSPNPDLALPVALEPVMRLVTEVVQVRLLPAGACVSYGRRTVLTRPSRIALLPVGYADGLTRRISPGFPLVVRARPAPVAGVVTMDLTMIDVTEIPEARPGDRVLLLGRDRQRDQSGREVRVEVAAEAHAVAARGIPYEILTGIGKRVRREYF